MQGSGFLSMAFGDGGTAARVFLVDGVYKRPRPGDGTRPNGLGPPPEQQVPHHRRQTTTIGLAEGGFTRDDIGRMFSLAPTVPDGTTVVSVAADGLTATISQPAIASTLGTLATSP
ncbi:hypothetical protein ACIA5D_20850 [Actinoplanes sp. NPDC051513]|uniref:hypothetical protein n=1 Tax=Actinoplanes sp. NPDC051513 TaxID=3363908 RepID=UPI003790DB68